MTMVSDENKQIAKLVAATFGGAPRVIQYLDEAEKSQIAVLHATDRPQLGLISFCTIGLSDYPIPGGRLQPPLGTEIAAVSDEEDFAAVLATAAFCVINSGWVAEPGRIFPQVVGSHIDGVTVPNLMFVNPFLWDDDLASRTLSTKTVAWLLGLPVSDAEMEYARVHGSDALEDMFEEAQIDVYDLRRPSVTG
jgi:antitoxin YqcF